ncbi:hypothetical protein O181_018054 [Austropuccinia psidii MF-1]|uniref:Secreted protein n=1 Tax=Austropuccinia psidii MF-1 TaxID=1389203 RepID=A0A9Q3C6X4_9BASI|nr:hypothetical protein [Austropuccinia psidii MF-1]
MRISCGSRNCSQFIWSIIFILETLFDSYSHPNHRDQSSDLNNPAHLIHRQSGLSSCSLRDSVYRQFRLCSTNSLVWCDLSWKSNLQLIPERGHGR